MVVTLNPPISQMVVTINPPTTFNANNIRQGGNHKSTYLYRFITSEPLINWFQSKGITIKRIGSLTP